ncbi:MAG: EAL domain-containing protein [Oscillibacter sp.]|nr:EAL domain-containing protein [Oscillibacter sp.]
MLTIPIQIPNLTILFIFLIYFFSLPRMRIRRNRMFLDILLTQSLTLAAALILGRIPPDYPAAWVRDLYVLYCAAYVARFYCYFIFTADLLRLDPKDAPVRTLGTRAAFLFTELAVLSNLWADSVFRLEDGRFQRGPLFFAAYVCFFSIFLSVFLIFTARTRLNGEELAAALICQALLFVSHVTQLYEPWKQVSATFCTMAVTILYLSFENPHLYLANRGNAFNMRAFRNLCSEMLRKKKPYRILSFALRDYVDMRSMYGGQQMDEGVVLISRFLVKTWPEYSVFYLRNGRYVILGPGSMNWEQVRREIYGRFQAAWIAEEAELDLSVMFVQLDGADGMDSVDRILNYLFLAFDNAEETLIQPDGLIDTASIQQIDRLVDVKRSLERCLEQNEVEIFLQPLIDGRLRRLVGAEVLSRIRDEQGNLISPSLFIPIAEKNGRINLMGEQVLEKACQFIRDYDLEAIGLQWINVNLSPIQCMSKDLSQRFSTILSQYGVDTNVIHLEITEQAVLDVPRLERHIQVLKSQGFRFSLDDYGSGYSNLSRVKRYPFANIKLDMAVVWDYFRDKDVLLPTVVRAFKDMGFSVTAEGIETAEIADAMCDLGCDYLQGYYFSKPLPVKEFVEKYTLLNQRQNVG